MLAFFYLQRIHFVFIWILSGFRLWIKSSSLSATRGNGNSVVTPRDDVVMLDSVQSKLHKKRQFVAADWSKQREIPSNLFIQWKRQEKGNQFAVSLLSITWTNCSWQSFALTPQTVIETFRCMIQFVSFTQRCVLWGDAEAGRVGWGETVKFWALP